MNKYWSSRLESLKPYTPGEQPKDQKFIKLNTNENPYPPSPLVMEAISAVPAGTLRLYPDPDCSGLRTALASRYGIRKSQIFVGNGSDEVLAFCFMAYFDEENDVLFPDITYSFYPVYAKLFGIGTQIVPLNEDMTVPLDKLTGSLGGVVLANPNAPTGIPLSRDDIRKLLDGNPECVVLIDEAYVDFGGESAVPLIEEYPNLVVVQTFSKSRALAGMRVGYAMGSESLIAALDSVKNSINSYTLDCVTLVAAQKAVEDKEYYSKNCAKIMETRDKTKERLRGIGFSVPDSAANFLFITHPRLAASEIFAALRRKGILVRHFGQPRVDNFLRVTIGTDEEMDILVRELGDIVSKA